jgi:hypothetical protein
MTIYLMSEFMEEVIYVTKICKMVVESGLMNFESDLAHKLIAKAFCLTFGEEFEEDEPNIMAEQPFMTVYPDDK